MQFIQLDKLLSLVPCTYSYTLLFDGIFNLTTPLFDFVNALLHFDHEIAFEKEMKYKKMAKCEILSVV